MVVTSCVVAVGAAALAAAAAVGAAVAAIAVAVGAANRRFLFSTNRRSFAANGGILRLRVGVATFSSTSSCSYASLNCLRPL